MTTVQMSKGELVDTLKKHTCEVVFIKVDQSKRVLNCTLLEKFLPPPQPSKTGKVKPPNDEVVNVWDLDNDGWRSFRIDSITSFTITS